MEWAFFNTSNVSTDDKNAKKWAQVEKLEGTLPYQFQDELKQMLITQFPSQTVQVFLLIKFKAEKSRRCVFAQHSLITLSVLMIRLHAATSFMADHQMNMWVCPVTVYHYSKVQMLVNFVWQDYCDLVEHKRLFVCAAVNLNESIRNEALFANYGVNWIRWIGDKRFGQAYWPFLTVCLDRLYSDTSGHGVLFICRKY